VIELHDYTVSVRNEHTGEMTTVTISAFSAQDAQIEALVLLFRSHGWRKAVAFLPVPEPMRAGKLVSQEDAGLGGTPISWLVL